MLGEPLRLLLSSCAASWALAVTGLREIDAQGALHSSVGFGDVGLSIDPGGEAVLSAKCGMSFAIVAMEDCLEWKGSSAGARWLSDERRLGTVTAGISIGEIGRFPFEEDPELV